MRVWQYAFWRAYACMGWWVCMGWRVCILEGPILDPRRGSGEPKLPRHIGVGQKTLVKNFMAKFSLVENRPMALSAVTAQRTEDESNGLRVIDEPIGLDAALTALEKGSVLSCTYVPKSVSRVELASDDEKANLVIYNAKFLTVVSGQKVEFTSSLSKKVQAALQASSTQTLTAKRGEISGRPSMDVSVGVPSKAAPKMAPKEQELEEELVD